MKYRIQATLIVDILDKSVLDAVMDKLRLLKTKLRTINLGSIHIERSRFELHECHHDEDPPTACVILESWESA